MEHRINISNKKYTSTLFEIGDRIKLSEYAKPIYTHFNKPNIPVLSTGHIHSIRRRYIGTLNEYCQYYIISEDPKIASYFIPHSTDYLYNADDLIKI